MPQSTRPTVASRALRIVLPTVMLGGVSCGLTGGVGIPDHNPAVIATGQHCVDDNPVRGCFAATIVLEESQLPHALRLWGYAPDEVESVGEPLVFVGFVDSSTCPGQVDDAVLGKGVLDVTITPLGSNGDCTADAVPRSFIIQMATNDIITAVTINGHTVELLAV